MCPSGYNVAVIDSEIDCEIHLLGIGSKDMFLDESYS